MNSSLTSSLLLSGMLASAASAQLSIVDVGLLPGTQSISRVAISGDGSAAVGECFYVTSSGALRTQPFRWTPQSGIQSLGTLPPDSFSFANGVSADGLIVAGESGGTAFHWSASTGIQALPGLGGASSASAVSGDGSVIVGYATAPATGERRLVRWTNGGSPQELGSPGGSNSVAPRSVSRDGSVVSGMTFDGPQPGLWRWTQTQGFENLGSFGAATPLLNGGSADASVLVGTAYDTSFPESAFRWSVPAGFVQLDPLSNYSEARALATNGAGNIVVGSCGSEAQGTSVACLWGESLLPIDVGGHFTSLGLDLTGWTLTNCTGVSDDGTVFTGRGIHNGVVAGWVVTIPAPGTTLPMALAGIACNRRRRPSS